MKRAFRTVALCSFFLVGIAGISSAIPVGATCGGPGTSGNCKGSDEPIPPTPTRFDIPSLWRGASIVISLWL